MAEGNQTIMEKAEARFVDKQKTAYEISECDWSSDVCSSDLVTPLDVKAGDRILFGKWSGTEVKVNGEDLLNRGPHSLNFLNFQLLKGQPRWQPRT